MSDGRAWKVEPDLTPDEDAEALDLIGWCWGAPESVRLVTGTLVWLDVPSRIVRRKLRKAK